VKRALQVALVLTVLWCSLLTSHLKGLDWVKIWELYKYSVLGYLASFFVAALGIGAVIAEYFPVPNARHLASLKRQFEAGKMGVKREQ